MIAHCRADNEQRTSDRLHRISHKAVAEVGMAAVRRPSCCAECVLSWPADDYAIDDTSS
jgi:hypothetical protein